MSGLTYGSVCSGIEAASVAWESLGWRADWFAEVDKAASAVLAYRFPEVPNHGDMTTLAARVRVREIPAPDVLVGGTPCQSFSVAGMRGGLSDPRGQLTLAYIDLADAIDDIRKTDGKPPCVIVWENVPGVLNHNDNPFGCFLAGIVGEDDELKPAGRKWTNAGAVFGPQRSAAWRIIDAQYVGLAQRRRRVFLVASARQGFDPAAILLEFDGVRRDSPPRREAGEGVTGTLDARPTGGGFPGTDGACSGHDVPAVQRPLGLDGAVGTLDTECGFNKATMQTVYAGHDVPCNGDTENQPVPQWWDGRDVSQTLDAVLHKGQTMPEKNRFPAVLQPIGFQASQSGVRLNQTAGTLDANYGPCRHNGVLQPIGGPITCFSSKDYGADVQDNLAPTLRAGVPTGSHANAGVPPAVCYGLTTEQTPKFNDDCALTLTKQSPTGGGQPQAVVYGFQPHIARNGRGDVVNALTAQAGETGKGDAAPCVAYAIQECAVSENPNAGPDDMGVRSDDCAYTLEARAVPQGVAYSVALRGRDGGGTAELGDNLAGCLRASGGGGDKPHVLAFDTTQITSPSNYSNPQAGDPCHPLAAGAHPPAVCVTGSVTHCLKAEGFDASEDGTGRGQPITVVHGTQDPCVGDQVAFAPTMAVRRLMPVECERLQGFPDGWTRIPVKHHAVRKITATRPPEMWEPDPDCGWWLMAADGPRYKQLGNSMATPCIAWIGNRIDKALSQIGHNGGPELDDFEDMFVAAPASDPFEDMFA